MSHLSPSDFRGLVFGFLAFLVFLVMNEELVCCINPQPGRPGDFWSRFSSSSPWIKLQGSSASFGPPRVFYFPGTRHIWWAFYPPPGEAPDGRLATSHGTTTTTTTTITIIIIIIIITPPPQSLTSLSSELPFCHVSIGCSSSLV